MPWEEKEATLSDKIFYKPCSMIERVSAVIDSCCRTESVTHHLASVWTLLIPGNSPPPKVGSLLEI